LVLAGALKFGDFTLKSGRRSPYFINTGMFQSGEHLAKLGEFYAHAIQANFSPSNFNFSNFNFLFGPAYKGIPLVAAVSIQLWDFFNINSKWCYNRKEKKDHGEGGLLVGYKPVDSDSALIIDDVVTAGTATRESIALLKAECPGVRISGLIISVDRMERGQGGLSAIEELWEEFNFPIIPIVNLDEIVNYLHNREVGGKVVLDDKIFADIGSYRQRYGKRS
jgi:orotate phosphoribosyltransferase